MHQATLLGLLLDRQCHPLRPFGACTAFAERLSELGRSLGVQVIGFGPADLAPARAEIPASIFIPGAGWWLDRMPLPDVCCLRCTRPDGLAAQRYLRSMGVPSINSGSLDKWESYTLLQQNPVLGGILPETRLLTGPEVLEEMVGRYGCAYLKPVRGSIGRGIARFTPAGPGELVCECLPSGEKGVRRRSVDRTRLARWLSSYPSRRRMIVQQGLPLAVFDGRVADVRALVQKDGTGRWQITGMGVRVGAPGLFTANLSTGGQALRPEALLSRIHPGDPRAQQRLAQQLAGLSLRICHAVEAATGSLGELGIDLGIDRSGRVWYIEQNSQPGRTIFARLGDHERSRLSYVRLLEYARFLAAQETGRFAAAAGKQHNTK